MVLTPLRLCYLSPLIITTAFRITLYCSSPQLCDDASYCCWDCLLLALRHRSNSRVVVSVIAGFGLQLHAEERGTHHIKLHEFCIVNGDVNAMEYLNIILIPLDNVRLLIQVLR